MKLSIIQIIPVTLLLSLVQCKSYKSYETAPEYLMLNETGGGIGVWSTWYILPNGQVFFTDQSGKIVKYRRLKRTDALSKIDSAKTRLSACSQTQSRLPPDLPVRTISHKTADNVQTCSWIAPDGSALDSLFSKWTVPLRPKKNN